MMNKLALGLFLITVVLSTWLLEKHFKNKSAGPAIRGEKSRMRLEAAPRAQKKAHTSYIHGQTRNDDYFWLRNRDTPEVLNYLEAENQWTKQFFEKHEPFQEKILSELKARMVEDDESVPVFRKGFWYYWRFKKGQEYQIHARKKRDLSEPEEILLDENERARGQQFLDVSTLVVSPDQSILAWGEDTVGRRFYTLRFKDLEKNTVLEDVIPDVTGDLVFANDNRTLFYTAQDPQTLRAKALYRYVLGSGQKPELIFTEQDETFNIGISRSKDERFLFLYSSRMNESTEVHFLKADDPLGKWQIFQPREKGLEYSVHSSGERFIVHTNLKAENFRLMETSLTKTGKENWRDFWPESSAYLEQIDVYDRFIVASELENANPHLRIIDLANLKSKRVEFPDPAYLVYVHPLPDAKAKRFRFVYQSPAKPPETIEEDFSTGEKFVLKQKKIPNVKPDRYKVVRLEIKARDGKRIPVSMVMKKDLPMDGNNPLLLDGYGAYGLNMPTYFDSGKVSLLDRGFIYAVAHVRGGSDLGRPWYEDGRLKKKRNTFLDFIDAAEGLIEKGYTRPEKIHARGGSAGGLLMGAVANMRPDLFATVLAHVPFVDAVNTMLDESIPLSTSEFQEWGNPKVKADYDYMMTYSPYDNVTAKEYPAMMVFNGYHDSQVQYWEAAKWVAKLRDLKTDSNPLLLHTEMSAGHQGASGRYESLKTEALEYLFVLLAEGQKE